MRRPAPLLAAVPLLALLAACGGSSAPSGAVAVGGLPPVVGAFGTVPTVKASGAAPTELKSAVLSEGSGATVAKGDLLVMNYLGQTWAANKKFDSSFDRKEPAAFPIGTGQVIPGFDKGLVGKKVGSRVELVIPPADGYGKTGQPDAGIKADDTLIFVVDIVGTHAAKESAEGAAVAPKAGLPTVTVAAGAKPAITVPKTPVPTTLVAQPLVTGTGKKVEKGQLLVAQYVGLTWRDGKQFDSSWDRGAASSFPIGNGSVIPGWDEGLVGQTVGSRVLLVVPPAKGYGAQGQPAAGIKGTDTLVFVVDILGSY